MLGTAASVHKNQDRDRGQIVQVNDSRASRIGWSVASVAVLGRFRERERLQRHLIGTGLTPLLLSENHG